MNKPIKVLILSCSIAALIGSSAVAMKLISDKQLERLSSLSKKNADNDYLFHAYGLRFYLGIHQTLLNNPETRATTLATFHRDLIVLFNFKIYRNDAMFRAIMTRTIEYLDHSTKFYTPEAIEAVKRVIETVLCNPIPDLLLPRTIPLF